MLQVLKLDGYVRDINPRLSRKKFGVEGKEKERNVNTKE